jgi:hypothetical protein
MLVDPHCQLLYPFENQAKDYSSHARHGTVNGSGVYATRPHGGRCLYFDGVGDYVATPSFGLSGTVVVFAAWVRNNPGITQCFLGDNHQEGNIGHFLTFSYISNPNLYWRYANGSYSSNAIATDYFLSPYSNVWLHLCIVCDYGVKFIYFYRNGIPFGSPVAMSGTPVFPSSDRVKYVGSFSSSELLLCGSYLANVQLGTLQTCPPVAELTANANRLMLGLHPIWSV